MAVGAGEVSLSEVAAEGCSERTVAVVVAAGADGRGLTGSAGSRGSAVEVAERAFLAAGWAG
jgi:hypothetical protein